MNDAPTLIVINSGDTLPIIASRHGLTVDSILALNPQLRSPYILIPGQRMRLPVIKFELTVRFVNLKDVPPVGVRYELLIGTKSMTKGTVALRDNEASFIARHAADITVLAQSIGETTLQRVASFTASREHPVMIVRLKSAKFSSATELHPRTATSDKSAETGAKSSAVPGTAVKKDQGLPNQLTKNEKGAAEHQILPGECACGRALSIDELAAIFPARKKAELTPFLEPLNKMMATYQIDSCLKKAHALAQIGHESGCLRYRAEILPKGATEDKSYDGYMGRGLIQITFKNNYQRYGKHKGQNFLDENRTKLESHEYAADSAGWFWTSGTPFNLNDYAADNDLIFISAAINGGFIGFDDRELIFGRAHRALNAHECKNQKNRSPAYLPFEKSKAYDTRDLAFAWGLWSDPDETKRKGLEKNSDASKTGYKRFIELNQANPIKNKRFGFKDTKSMLERAEERSK